MTEAKIPMIVGIPNSLGRFEVRDLDTEALEELRSIETEIIQLFERSEREYAELLARMVALVRERGQTLPVEVALRADYVLPPADMTFCQAHDLILN